MACQIFISLRFAEASREAAVLKHALEQKGVSTFLCAVPEGDDIKDQIVYAIDACKLVVVMGTQTYGVKTDSPFSTHEEMEFIVDEKKPFFLVKMCERFQDAKTRFNLRKSISFFDWPSGTSMPERLVDRIITKLGAMSDVDEGTGLHVARSPASSTSSSSQGSLTTPHNISQLPLRPKVGHITSTEQAGRPDSRGGTRPYLGQGRPNASSHQADRPSVPLPGLARDTSSIRPATKQQLEALLRGAPHLSNTIKGVLRSIHGNSCQPFVTLVKSGLGPSGAKALAAALSANTCLLGLNIAYSVVADEGCIALAESLRTNRTLKFLGLRGNNIGDSAAQALAEILENTPSPLRGLGLAENQIGDAGADALNRLLRSKTCHLRIGLGGNAASPTKMESFVLQDSLYSRDRRRDLATVNVPAHKMQALSKIQALLSQHSNMPAHVKSTIASIATDTCAPFISFCNWDLRGKSVEILAEALNMNTNLKTLNLANTNVGDLEVTILAPVLAKSNLQGLGLRGNRIGDHGIKALMNAIQSSSARLTSLGLANNMIGDAGAEHIRRALESNVTLHRVGLSGNNLSAAVATALPRSCRKHNKEVSV